MISAENYVLFRPFLASLPNVLSKYSVVRRAHTASRGKGTNTRKLVVSLLVSRVAWPAEQRQRRRGKEPWSWCVEAVLDGTSGKFKSVDS